MVVAWALLVAAAVEALAPHHVEAMRTLQSRMRSAGLEGRPAAPFPTQTRRARLNHFDPNDSRLFDQHFWVNSDHYRAPAAGQPSRAILYINGEGPVSGPPAADTDETVMLAKRYGALIVTLEHRYYGASNPCNSLPEFCTQDAEHLAYLSVIQHMEDLAEFIGETNARLFSADPLPPAWICVGGSYSGATSAWFRTKYPHLVQAAVSSSGVVNAIYDFHAWDGQVSASVGPACAARLSAVLEGLEQRFAADPNALCAQFDSDHTCAVPGDFFRAIADVFGETVQYGFQLVLCPLLEATADEDLVPVFANYTTSFWVPRFGALDQYSTAIQAETQWSLSDAFNYRLWWWQKATEFAWLQTPSAPTPMRSAVVNMTYYAYHIEQLFGPNIVTGSAVVDHTNLIFGGNGTAGSRIVFVDGSQDPWKHASIAHSLGPDRPYIEVSCLNCGHCQDLKGTCYGGCQPNADAIQVAWAAIVSYMDQWF
jgi:pimeloyl-ACP methyl ester carboxylesterase